jgi:hypothetical protein
MRVARLVPVAALAAGVLAQATFEPEDFDPMAALENLGVDVSILSGPESNLSTRSYFAPCALAVSTDRYHPYVARANNDSSVVL